MLTRPFGRSGLRVSALGFGAGHIGDPALDERHVERLLHAALDAGITLFDTARSYGASEERIGRLLATRRSQIVLSTKVGYGVPGVEDWTAEAVRLGVEAALRRLNTDALDVVHLHSCPRDLLQRGEVVEALHRTVEAGHVRVAAYSGEGDALAAALDDPRFGAVQCSANLCDQRNITGALADAARRGMGRIAKRPLANAPWRFEHQPHGHYAEPYWLRLRAMALDELGLPWPELALRFAAFSSGADTAIVGTASLTHLQQHAEAVERGPLPDDIVARLRDAFHRGDQRWGWEGLI